MNSLTRGSAVNDVTEDSRQAIRTLRDFVTQHIVGQDVMVDRLLVALLADGHLLV